MDESLFYYVALVPLLGVAAQWLAWRLKLPSILLLLTFGVLLGQFQNPDVLLNRLYDHAGTSAGEHGEADSQHVDEAEPAAAEGAESGTDQTEPNQTKRNQTKRKQTKRKQTKRNVGPGILFPIVSLCVCVIMFEGGLSLRLSELRESGLSVFRLVSIGALISMVLTGFAAYYIFQLNWRVAALLGGLLVVTGPTVVVPLLRHIRPSRKIGSIVKWEGIVIDPVGAILAALIFERLIHHMDDQYFSGISMMIILRTVAISLALGTVAAVLLVQMVKRYWIPDYLHGVFFLSVALAIYAASNWIQAESGLVTVTLLGVLLANQKSISIEHVVQFKENLGVLLISCLFIVLGSRLDIAGMMEIGPRGLLFVLVLIVLVRPVSIFISTIGAELSWQEKVFLAFLAPRGIVAAAVASVFGLHIISLAGHFNANDPTQLAEIVRDAEQLAPITFMVIVGTVAFYGLAAAPLARKLGLEDANPQGILFAGADDWICRIAEALQEAGFSVALVDTNYRRVTAARVANLNARCMSILAEELDEQVDLVGVGRLIALTASDEVNALATREFRHLFGRKNVFQLMPADAASRERASVSEKHRGRTFVDDSVTRDQLVDFFKHGWQVKTTSISDEFTFADFQALYGDDALILFVIDAKSMLHVINSEDKPDVTSNQKVIALVDPTRLDS